MKTVVIGEIGANWSKLDDIYHTCEFLAKEGCLPKLQLWKTNKVVNKSRNPKMYETMKHYELKHDWVKAINSRFPQTFYSVFDLDSLAFLHDEIKPDNYKIASPDCVYEPLVGAVAGLHKHTFMSVGGATLEEIRTAIKPFCWHDLTLMECNASYPAKCAYLGNLRDRINGSRLIPWGYSDHTLSMIVPSLAVSLGATAIEKHVQRSGISSPDSPHSLCHEDFVVMLDYIKEAEAHLQTAEHPFEEEWATMKLARRKEDGRR